MKKELTGALVWVAVMLVDVGRANAGASRRDRRFRHTTRTLTASNQPGRVSCTTTYSRATA